MPLQPEHKPRGNRLWTPLVIGLVLLPVIIVLMTGLFTLQPNEARVLLLFGAYKGTVREAGFHWGNPFYSNGPQQQFGSRLAQVRGTEKPSQADAARQGRNKISLRARTYNSPALKVNDKRGNPIEIAAVVVWRGGRHRPGDVRCGQLLDVHPDAE